MRLDGVVGEGQAQHVAAHSPWRLAARAAASIVGGYVDARLALRVRPAHVRALAITIGISLAGYFFVRQYGG